MAPATTEVEKAEQGGALATRPAAGDLVKERLAGMQISDLEIPTVSVPGSGGQVWEVDGEPHKVLRGVIIDDYAVDTYYRESFNDSKEKNNPPDALWIAGQFQYANDAAVEDGVVPGPLVDQPLAKFDENLGRTPISNRWRVFMVLEDEFAPIRIEVPIMSRKKVANFLFSKVAGRGFETTDVLVELGLTKLTSKGGIEYAQIVPSLVEGGKLDDAQRAHYRALAEGFRPLTRRANSPDAAVDQTEAAPDEQPV